MKNDFSEVILKIGLESTGLNGIYIQFILLPEHANGEYEEEWHELNGRMFWQSDGKNLDELPAFLFDISLTHRVVVIGRQYDMRNNCMKIEVMLARSEDTNIDARFVQSVFELMGIEIGGQYENEVR